MISIGKMSIILFMYFPGVFIPPVDGVYLLTTQAITEGTLGGHMFIKKNDEILCQTYVYPADAYASSCSAVAQLAAGDSVRVTGNSDQPASIDAAYSGFAGHIISDKLTA